MRTFYAFKIKKEIISLYKSNSKSLYDILKHLYYMKKNDMKFGYNMFKQLTNRIDKEELDKIIYIKYHNNMTYSKNDNQHIINNLYKDEISIMIIKTSYLLINVNHNFSSFFEIINSYSDDYFICDFEYNDYFWIYDLKTLV